MLSTMPSVRSCRHEATLLRLWIWYILERRNNEETSARLARKLLSSGYAKVYALEGGWDDWLKAEYPVEKKSPLLL